VSDDGSTDGTREYLQSLNDARIKIFSQVHNLGIFGNLNYLFSKARAPITQILCQDDRFSSADSLRSILAIWNSLPDAIAFLRCNHGSEKGSALIAMERDILPAIVEPRESDLFFFVFGCIPGNLSNVSIRTSVIEEMGWFRTDLPYAGDFEFWSRVGRDRPWAISRARVVFVREHPGQASATLNKHGELLSQLHVVIGILFQKLRERELEPAILRLMATSSYAMQHLDIGLRAGIFGNGWEYFALARKYFLKSRYFLGSGLSGILYCVSVRGRFYGPTIARRLIERHRRKATVVS
jgi:glycosyltransferase involved in cell wall biosynthesis